MSDAEGDEGLHGEAGAGLNRELIRPTETECNHRAERGLKLILESPDEKAVRIGSNPNPMFVTVEDSEFVFWSFNYTWKCQERREMPDVHGPYETVVDQLHAYANTDGYGIGTVSKDRIDTERKPRATGLVDFA